MHDPDFVLFEVALPVPVRRWRDTTGDRWQFKRSRRTNDENLGEPVYPWWRAEGYRVVAAGQRIGLWQVATVWHHEPGDQDTGTVCKGRHDTFRWAFEHRGHLWVQVIAFSKYRRWVTDRCDSCGQRFGLKEGRFSNWDGDEKLHDSCHQVRHMRYQLDDVYTYLIRESQGSNVDWNMKWRVEREMLRRLNRDGLEKYHPEEAVTL